MSLSLRLPALALLAAATTSATAQTQDPGLARLEAELGRISRVAGGKVGVGIIHLESGRELYLAGDERFPMASTFKVPIALQLLDLVDRGRLRLDSMIALGPTDLHPGSGTLTRLLDDPGVELSVRNLLELMLLISDNSATDILLRTVGGPSAVNARLAAVGVEGIRVDRPTVELIADAIGIKNLPPDSLRTMQRFRALVVAIADSNRRAARDSLYRDPRDTATPRGMARLLAKLWRREALSASSTDLLIDVMYRCQTGENRLKGLLPRDTRVAHKTGTLDLGVANDVGIIDLPGGAGHAVVAAFVKESSRPTAEQERAIAEVARAVHDYFLFVR
jgi:beta-lactamase class A